MGNNIFPLVKGSDLDFTVAWGDGAGGLANLTGYSAAIYDPHAALAGFVTIAITAPLTGGLTGRINWSDGFLPGRQMSFAIRLTAPDGITTQATTPLWVDVT